MSESTASHDHHDSHDDVSKHLKVYWRVGGLLFLFTAITVAVAYYVDLHSRPANIALGLAIATFKSSMVALIFMHLNHERNLIYKVLVFTGVFAFAMMFLILWAHSDPIPVGDMGVKRTFHGSSGGVGADQGQAPEEGAKH